MFPPEEFHFHFLEWSHYAFDGVSVVSYTLWKYLAPHEQTEWHHEIMNNVKMAKCCFRCNRASEVVVVVGGSRNVISTIRWNSIALGAERKQGNWIALMFLWEIIEYKE